MGRHETELNENLDQTKTRLNENFCRSRVMLKVARGVHSSVPPRDKGGGVGGSGGRAAAGAGKGADGCEEVEVAVVRAPDVTGDEVVFAAKVIVFHEMEG